MSHRTRVGSCTCIRVWSWRFLRLKGSCVRYLEFVVSGHCQDGRGHVSGRAAVSARGDSSAVLGRHRACSDEESSVSKVLLT